MKGTITTPKLPDLQLMRYICILRLRTNCEETKHATLTLMNNPMVHMKYATNNVVKLRTALD